MTNPSVTQDTDGGDGALADRSAQVLAMPVRRTSDPYHIPRKKVPRGAVEPTPDELAKDAEEKAKVAEEKAKFIEKDPLVLALKGGKIDSVSVLRIIRQEVAVEVAALKHDRLVSGKAGKETSQQSRRRIEALLKLASIEANVAKHASAVIDVYSEPVQKILALWITSLHEVAAETLPPETIEVFFNRLQTALDGWEDRAESALR